MKTLVTNGSIKQYGLTLTRAIFSDMFSLNSKTGIIIIMIDIQNGLQGYAQMLLIF